MDLQLASRHVLITGGSKGIGLACANGFLAEGAHVTLVSRDRTTLDAARDSLLKAFPGGKVHVCSADLKVAAAALAAIEDAEQAMGPVDVLVNSAGAARRTPPAELTPQHWRDAMDAKFFTYVNMTDPLVKRMAQRGAGVVLNIVGMGGKVASPTHLAGGSANAALMLMSAGLAAAYGPKGVRVNAVNPALTLTERMDEGLAADARLNNITKEEALAKASARMPLGRVASPEEIANAVLFLCSPRASYISGAIVSMDGAVTPLVV
ncbi:MAG TPA: SDR family oxidoreductase [Ramlibacter sp.]|uniref:SDR family oxidoreductase n=1 Tax=Ramlibacter sp. TaxID=1917967 RepID=UPI002BD9210A|nr:SDR family oxidoreductase [Ramlibacter sp.]HVZ45249.1 SDR family oxidoreductase [Ramlibacter sp.]